MEKESSKHSKFTRKTFFYLFSLKMQSKERRNKFSRQILFIRKTLITESLCRCFICKKLLCQGRHYPEYLCNVLGCSNHTTNVEIRKFIWILCWVAFVNCVLEIFLIEFTTFKALDKTQIATDNIWFKILSKINIFSMGEYRSDLIWLIILNCFYVWRGVNKIILISV